MSMSNIADERREQELEYRKTLHGERLSPELKPIEQRLKETGTPYMYMTDGGLAIEYPDAEDFVEAWCHIHVLPYDEGKIRVTCSVAALYDTVDELMEDFVLPNQA